MSIPTDYSDYHSPFSLRYASREMRNIFSEEHKYRLWRKIWVELARAEHAAGLVRTKELEDLVAHEQTIDIARLLEIEKETKHDVVAGIREFAEHATIGGGKIHLGATSMDIVDNADMVRIREAFEIIKGRIDEILKLYSDKIVTYATLPCIGYTHLQPAEPTTVGYRIASYAQDLYLDRFMIRTLEPILMKGKGFKGAVGTGASYTALLQGSKKTTTQLEDMIGKRLGISSFLITSQVYPRKADYLILTLLSSIAGSIAKFAEDLRILQSPSIGEWSEPFGKKQVGSSAMPFKKNPVQSEKICSLARYISALPHVAWENAALSHLERTLDDSANKRIIISEAFLALDEILLNAQNIISGLVIHTERIAFNLAQYAPFAATESILLYAVQHGGNRQEIHELLRSLSMKAWKLVQSGEPNPLVSLIEHDNIIQTYIPVDALKTLFDVRQHIGDAPERATQLAREIQKSLL